MEGAPETTDPLPNRAEGPTHEDLPTEVWLAPWRNEAVESYGFDARSMYVESCWLPILGPTATWLYRRLGSWAEWHPEGFQLDLTQLGQSLGISNSRGRSSPLSRSFRRLVAYGAVRFDGEQLQARIAMPPLKAHHLARLTPDLRTLHQQLTREAKPAWEQ